MKNYLPLFLIVLFFLPSLACIAFSTNSVRGSGNIITQTVDVSNFDSVSLEGSGNVYIEQGQAESLTIEADDNIMPLLETEVKGDTLVLSTRPNQNINPSKPVVYRLTVKYLNDILLKGSGNFFVEPLETDAMDISVLGSGDTTLKGMTGDSIFIDLMGSGNITLDEVDVKTIDTTVNGSGDIMLSGNASSQKVKFRGSGNYMAGDLETDTTEISIPGSADVTVWVNDSLKVNINGSGSVEYYGKPTVDQNGLGSGKTVSLGEK